jgi:hypothetical protein
MPDLFVAMFREEWRVHSELFGSVGFALFPVLIGAMACMGTVLVPIVNAALPAGDLATIVHLLFLLIGVMVGGFGLVGNEAMNRRFGQASFVAYAARTLPVSERRIFAAFVAKDTVYYLLLWILPVIAGVALASPFAGLAPSTVLRLALTLLLAFLAGMAGAFVITTVWGRSKVAFAVLVGVLVTGIVAFVLASGSLPPFPPLQLYRSFSWPLLAATLAGIGVALAVSLLLFQPTSSGGERRHPDRFSSLAHSLERLPYPALAAKDLLDLWRSGGGVGQVLFALLLPLGLCWFLLSLLGPVLPPDGVLMLFAVLAGVLGSTVYTWLTAFDTFGPYGCLPIGVETLIRSKLTSFSLLQVVPAAVVVVVALGMDGGAVALPAVALALGLSAWAVALTVYLAGLSPNVLVYNPKVLAAFLGGVGLPIIALVALAFASPWFGLTALLLVVPAASLVSAGVRRWEAADRAFF